jgi:anaerobic magnesium-protoporphyrin IX monomethyl ester cyclase
MDMLLSNSHFLYYDLVEQPLAYIYPPLGPLYLSAYLKNTNVGEVGVFDVTFAKGAQEFEQYLQAKRPRLIGIQAIITTRTRTRNMLHIARSMGIPVVVGGPDASASYEQYLNWGATYAVIGEGEETSTELLQFVTKQSDIGIKDIRGLAYKNNGQIVKNGNRPLIQNLDHIPFPDWKAIYIDRYLDLWHKKNGYTSLQILASRGCPFGCAWCSRAVFGRTVRRRSVDNVIGEMKALSNLFNPDSIWFADDTFTMEKSWVEAFSEKVTRSGLVLPFRCFTRADQVTPEILSKLKSAGCRLIHMGVESGSQQVLDAMNKGQKVETIRKASNYIHDAGIEINYFIMFGYPGEKLKDIRATETLIKETKPESIGFSIAYPVPGTEFYQSVKDYLVKDIDLLWEKTIQDIQQMFNMEFPPVYYRKTIQHIQLRNLLQTSSTGHFKNRYVLVKIAWLGFIRWIIEQLWLGKKRFLQFPKQNKQIGVSK